LCLTGPRRASRKPRSRQRINKKLSQGAQAFKASPTGRNLAFIADVLNQAGLVSTAAYKNIKKAKKAGTTEAFLLLSNLLASAKTPMQVTLALEQVRAAANQDITEAGG